MSKYSSWPTTDQGNIVGGRLANEVYHRFTGDLNALSLTDQRDAALAELLATTPEMFNVKSFGAKGDGVTDDIVAIQATIDSASAGSVVVLQPSNYKVSDRIRVTTSGLHIIGYGATITSSVAGVSGIEIGHDGSAFVKTDKVTIEGLTFVGADDGSGSTTSFAINLREPTTNPYVYGGGCSRTRIINCTASAHTFGVSGTAADQVLIAGCHFGSMKYHATLSAGGYCVLMQTCFDVIVEGNHFLAASGDRHAVYISANSDRTKNNDNICKGVVIAGNLINWTGVAATTGAEAAIVLRSPENCNVTGNEIRGGYGGIDYEIENGNGRNLTITGNTFDDQLAAASERACVAFLRTSGSFTVTGVSITGNTMTISTALVHGVSLFAADSVVVSGNSVSNTGGLSFIKIAGTVTDLVTSGNRVVADNLASAVYHFTGSSNSDILIGVDHITLSNGSAKWLFTSDPTNLTTGFNRSATIRANSTSSPAITFDSDSIVKSVAVDANGIVVTFEDHVQDVQNRFMWFGSNASGVGQVYYRSRSDQVVIIGVLDFTGSALPSETNTYDIDVFLLH